MATIATGDRSQNGQSKALQGDVRRGGVNKMSLLICVDVVVVRGRIDLVVCRYVCICVCV